MGFTPNLDGLLVMNGEIDPEKPSYKGSRGWLTDIKVNAEPVGVGEMVETIVRHGYQHHYPLVYDNLQAAAVEMAAYLDIPVIEAEPYRDYLVG